MVRAVSFLILFTLLISACTQSKSIDSAANQVTDGADAVAGDIPIDEEVVQKEPTRQQDETHITVYKSPT